MKSWAEIVNATQTQNIAFVRPLAKLAPEVADTDLEPATSTKKGDSHADGPTNHLYCTASSKHKLIGHSVCT